MSCVDGCRISGAQMQVIEVSAVAHETPLRSTPSRTVWPQRNERLGDGDLASCRSRGQGSGIYSDPSRSLRSGRNVPQAAGLMVQTTRLADARQQVQLSE